MHCYVSTLFTCFVHQLPFVRLDVLLSLFVLYGIWPQTFAAACAAFLPRDARNAKCGIAIVSRPVTLTYRVSIRRVSSKVIISAKWTQWVAEKCVRSMCVCLSVCLCVCAQRTGQSDQFMHHCPCFQGQCGHDPLYYQKLQTLRYIFGAVVWVYLHSNFRNAKRGIAIISRPSVCPSITLMYREHIGWTSSKLITQICRVSVVGGWCLGLCYSRTHYGCWHLTRH